MTDWTGNLTPITAPAAAVADCVTYLTVADVRAEFSADVAAASDSEIQRKIDRLAGFVEEQIGHGFGRGLLAQSTAADTIVVTATELTIGGDAYAFATYATLQALVAAANAAGAAYGLELLPHVPPDTPSTLLALVPLRACGPAYENRAYLCLSARYVRASGRRETHLFLPQPLASVTAVVEDGVTLAATDYWAVPGDPWLIRKACGCITPCYGRHPRGVWACSYPGNITVAFVPSQWGRAPLTLRGHLLEAYSAQAGLAPFQAEDFGDYGYRRPQAPVSAWTDILGGGVLRPYADRFQP